MQSSYLLEKTMQISRVNLYTLIRFLLEWNILFRINNLFINHLRLLFGHLRAFQWDTSRSLDYQTWIHWCDTFAFDLVMIQEIGWSMTNEWSSPRWHLIHSVDRFVGNKSRWLRTYRGACFRYAWISIGQRTGWQYINRPGQHSMESVKHSPRDDRCGHNFTNIWPISPKGTWSLFGVILTHLWPTFRTWCTHVTLAILSPERCAIVCPIGAGIRFDRHALPR